MNIKATKMDIIWNYIGTVFSLSSQFLLLPFILLFLESDEIGLWYVFLAIAGMVTLFDFGFNPTFARNVAYCWSGAERLTKEGCIYGKSKEKNFRLLKIMISTCKLQYGIISIIALIFIATFGTIYVLHISRNLVGTNHIYAWGIFCIAIFFNLYFGYFAALLRGVGAIYRINQATIISRLCQIVISAILLYLDFGLVAVSVGYLINGICLRLICKNAFFKYQGIKNQLNKVKDKITRKEIIDLYKTISFNAYKDGAVSLSNYLATQATSIISSFFISLSETGIYSISLQFVTAIANISSAIIVAYHPTLQSAHINQDKDTEKKFISKGIAVFYALYPIGVISVIVIVFPLLEIISPTTVKSIPVFLGLSLYTFLWKQQSFFASFIANTNRIPYMKGFLISSILGVLFSIVFVRNFNMGIWGVIIGPGIVQLVYNNWKWPHFVVKELNTSLFELLKNGFADWKKVVLLKLRKN